MITILGLIIIPSIVLSVHFNEDSRRHLATCSSFSSCESCNEETDGNYLNGGCDSYDKNSWQFNVIDQTQMSSYGHNSQNGDNLYAKNYGYDLNLYAYANATVSSYRFCEWKIIFSSLAPVTLSLKKDSLNYEDIYLYANSESGQTYFYSKDFSDCAGDDINLTIKNITYVRLRIKKLNDLSNYSVSFTQDGLLSSNDGIVVFAVIVVGGVVVSIGMIVLFILFMVYVAKQNKNRQIINATPAQLEKVAFIKRGLNNMASSDFSKLDIPFEQKTCVICLDDLKNASPVNLVNECSHAIHWKCLNTWFRNIRCDKDLVCPHGHVVITDQSKPHNSGSELANNLVYQNPQAPETSSRPEISTERNDQEHENGEDAQHNTDEPLVH